LLFPNLQRWLRSAFLGVDTPLTNPAAIVSDSIDRPEGKRHYLKALPSSPANGKRPLVVLLHGSGASADQILGRAFPPSPLSVWLEIAEREQWVVVALDGSKQAGERSWNDGWADITANPATDDVGLVDAVIERAIARDAVDPTRVYVMGVSKGGLLTYRVAAELGAKLAAFAVVLAPMPVRCAYAMPTMPLSALIVAGTADPLMPYRGRRFLYTLRALSHYVAPLRSVADSVAVWRQLANLPEHPIREEIPHLAVNDPTRGGRYTWGNDPAALQVRLLCIERGGHAEPSAKKRYPAVMRWFPGAQNADVETAEEAWDFFQHKRAVARGQQVAVAAEDE
jgi:polyhydroxybutyrate depolymerase